MTFPSPPWRMQGQLWLSLLRTSRPGPADRPAGRPACTAWRWSTPARQPPYVRRAAGRSPGDRDLGPAAGRRVTVTDIWVGSEPSREGGRALWAEVTVDGAPLAQARFSAPPVVLPRVPSSGTTWQPRDDGSSVVASLSGSSRSFPVRGSWTFDPDGPLGWLAGARPLASLVMREFRMAFG